MLLDRAEEQLAAAGVPSPRVDAELLLAHATGRPRALVRSAGELPVYQVERYAGLVDRRARREPLQHLTGTAPFRYLELLVGPGVFVPRPETELLADAVLSYVRDMPRLAASVHASPSTVSAPSLSAELVSNRGLETRVAHEFTERAPTPADGRGPLIVDLCTGSGALALALATELSHAAVHAVEVDAAAATWARRNLDAHRDRMAQAGSSMDLVVADATVVAEPGGPLADLAGRVDVVVSNPPYIPDAAVPRDPEVRDHDPALALFGGPDGLDVIRLLVDQAARLLRPGGLLVIEHADVQGDDAGPLGVPGLVRASPHWTDVADHTDLSGLPRYTTASRSAAATRCPAPSGLDELDHRNPSAAARSVSGAPFSEPRSASAVPRGDPDDVLR